MGECRIFCTCPLRDTFSTFIIIEVNWGKKVGILYHRSDLLLCAPIYLAQ